MGQMENQVRISRQINVVGVCYRLHDEEEEAKEAFLRQMEEALSLQALVFKEYFNHCSICWRGNNREYEQYRMFLECIYDSFLTKVIKELIKEGALLDVTLTNKEELARDVNAGGSLGCSDHKIVKFSSCSGSGLEELHGRWQMVFLRITSSRFKKLSIRTCRKSSKGGRKPACPPDKTQT